MRLLRVLAPTIVVLSIAGVAYASYVPPTKQEIRQADGPITTLTEIDDNGVNGLVFAQENVREIGVHPVIDGLTPAMQGKQLTLAFATGECGSPAGKILPFFRTTVDGEGEHFRGLLKTQNPSLRKSFTLRAKSVRGAIDGKESFCDGPVLVLRLSNDEEFHRQG